MFSLTLAFVKKELQLLARDLHGLLVLFVMPIVFVLIMSLAMQDQINGRTSIVLDGQLKITAAERSSETAQAFVAELGSYSQLRFGSTKSAPIFTVALLPGFTEAVNGEFSGAAVVDITYIPELGKREQLLIYAAVKEAFARVSINALSLELGFSEDYTQKNLLKTGAVVMSASSNNRLIEINATQQNVPAWLVFAMFFVNLPVSTVVINERRQKSLLRLRTMGVSSAAWLGAKLLPYLLINIAQFILMLFVGAKILPLFGAVALSLNVSLCALSLMALSVSISALGFAALIACVAKTTEQATILAGTSNIIFGALGGVMVPSFFMPEFMRWLTHLSPMGWGLEGLLQVLVYGKGVGAIGIYILVLAGFGVSSLLLSFWVFGTRKYG